MNRVSTERKARAAIYRDAARRLEKARRSNPNNGFGGYYNLCGCCDAIGAAMTRAMEGADLESPFEALFKPEGASLYWWGDCMCHLPDTKGERVLALCFMGAIEEAGDSA